MVASDKIEEAKNCFQNIKQSGRNNYQKYDYFELKDILPLVRKICKQFNLKTQINTNLELQCFVLRITDKDDNSYEEFVAPLFLNSGGDIGKMNQDYGRSQTYSIRYLYLQAFEIAVPDMIDNKDQRKTDVKGTKSVPKREVTHTKKVVKPKNVSPVEPVIEQKTDEITEQDVKQTLDQCYNIIVEQGGKEFTEASALWQLKRICNDKPQLLSACKNALKMYTADKT